MRTIRFGIIGAGLMGREFVSAAARWAHLPDMKVRPEIVALCDMNPAAFGWYQDHFPTIRQYTSQYKELLANPDVDAVYVAVPHNLHEEIYSAVIRAGKHLMGEKPFGIDRQACRNILAAIKQNPGCFVRCASEFPFFPAAQKLCSLIESGAIGQIIEVNASFFHSSDMDPSKPINWKRMIEFNGEYGCMGDLGLHVCHIPFRAGWLPRNVRAFLADLVKERPDGKGSKVPCRTWDNATLFCEAEDRATTQRFPMTLKTFRMAPGEKDSWSLEVLGTKTSARFSTKNPKLLQIMVYGGGEQAWQHLDMGHETTFKSITGGIFEFGFSDALLQMWAAFLYELTEGKPQRPFAGCVTPEEAGWSHELFTAALKSHADHSVVPVQI